MSNPTRVASRIGPLLVFAAAVCATPASAQPQTIEYDVPLGSPAITSGPDGRIWFSGRIQEFPGAPHAPAIGYIDPAFPNPIEAFPLDGMLSYETNSLIAGDNGEIWFSRLGRISRIPTTPPHTIETFPISGDFEHDGAHMARGGDGNLWFMGRYQGARAIIRLEANPPHDLTAFPIPSPAPVDGEPFTGPDGDIWWCFGTRIGRVDTSPPHEISSIELPFDLGAIYNKCLTGPDGRVWYTRQYSYGSIETSPPFTVTEYSEPSMYGPVNGTVGPDGSIWITGTFDQDDGAALWRFSPANPASIETIPAPAAGNTILAVAAGADGNLWYTPFLPERSVLARLVLTPLCTGVTCTALDQCHDAGTCNPNTGGCSQPWKPDGTACTGAAACAEPDACQIGICTDALCVSDTAPVGGTVSTDDGGGATPAQPVQTSVTVPGGGMVDITQAVPLIEPPGGFSFAGQLITIAAPAQTAALPLQFTFVLDASRIPPGVDPVEVDIYRNGVELPDCTGSSGMAEPDPCVSERLPLPDADLRVTVLTSMASDWFAAVPRCQRPSQAKVIATKINSDTTPGNDGLKIIATFTLPGGAAFGDFDPRLQGAQVHLYDAAGSLLVEGDIPPGAYAGAGSRGWSRNKKGTVWTYRDKTPAPVLGITKVVIADRSKRAANEVKATVVAKRGTYAIGSGSAPLRAAVVLGGTQELRSRACGETDFAPSDCAFNASGNALRCKR